MKRIIYQTPEGGVVVIIPTGEVPIEEVAVKDVPQGITCQIVDNNAIPKNRTFRAAWKMGKGRIEHDLLRCKEIAHDRRRAARAAELAPYDEVIMKQIPGTDAKKAEAERQKLRDKYAEMQIAIDAATNVDQLLEVTP